MNRRLPQRQTDKATETRDTPTTIIHGLAFHNVRRQNAERAIQKSSEERMVEVQSG